MSRKVATLVYDRRVGSAARKAVLAYFADRADDFGCGIFASKQTIADETELGRSTVIRVVNEFVSEGVLLVVGSRPCRNGATVVYDINLTALKAFPAISDGDNQSQSGTSSDEDQSQSGTPPVPERDPMGSQSGTQTVLEPSLNHPPTPKGASFGGFWGVWPNKTAKASAEKAWKKLSAAERDEAFGNAAGWFAAWRKAHPDASPIHPASYLNQKRWQDEGWRKTPAKSVDRLAVAADAIRSGKRFLCAHITPSLARELVAANAVTPEQCKQVGVSL